MDRNATAVDVPSTIVGGRPIRPSWVDRLQARIDRLPGPPWVVYALSWLALAGTETALKWLDGTYAFGTLFGYHVVAFGTPPVLLALLHHLDRSADRALNALRPALRLDDAAVARFRERLVHLPAGPTLIVTVVGTAFGAAQRYWVATPRADVLRYASDGPVAAFEIAVVALLGWAVIAIVAYAGVRQVLAIDAIYRHCVDVDLFDAGAMYAFTGHAARMALGLLAMGSAWLVTYPRDPMGEAAAGLLGGTLVAFTSFAIVVFLTPLWAAHQRLVAKRRLRIAAANHRLQVVLSEQHRRLDAAEYTDVDATAKAVAALTSELSLLERTSTWPWPAATLRGFLTAVLLPLFLFASQQILSAVFQR